MSGSPSAFDAPPTVVPRVQRWLLNRSTLVLFHRYVGLALAAFLLMAGITGSLLAWNHELEAWAAPSLWRVERPHADAPQVDPLLLRDRVQALYPDTFVARAPLKGRPDQPVIFRLFALPDPVTGAAQELANDEVFVDPYTGRVLGQRKWGDVTQGAKNLMPFVYRLHHTLLFGEVGSYVLGVIALLWTVDCFVGAWLTFPPRRRASRGVSRDGAVQQKSWLGRWRTSWSLRWRGSSSYRRHLDVHRVAGLWPWAMLFVVAWSAVAFNLSEVHDPVMKAFFAHQADKDLPMLDVPRMTPALDWQAARRHGRVLMAQQAAQDRFEVLEEDALTYDPRNGIYSYRVRSTRDAASRWGITQLSFDGETGMLLKVWLPTGSASGDTIRTWTTTLHMAGVGGWPLQLLVCGVGLAVSALSVTGVAIWWKKRAGRRKLATRSLAKSRLPR